MPAKAIAKKPAASMASTAGPAKHMAACAASVKKAAVKHAISKKLAGKQAISKKPAGKQAVSKRPAGKHVASKKAAPAVAAGDADRVAAEKAFEEHLRTVPELSATELGLLPLTSVEEGPWMYDGECNAFCDQVEFVRYCGAKEIFNLEVAVMPKLKGPTRWHRPCFTLKVGIYDNDDPRMDGVSIGMVLQPPVFSHWVKAATFQRIRRGSMFSKSSSMYSVTAGENLQL